MTIFFASDPIGEKVQKLGSTWTAVGSLLSLSELPKKNSFRKSVLSEKGTIPDNEQCYM